MKNRRHTINAGSGNVFRDLRLPRASELSIQAELTRLIHERIQELGWTQAVAAERLSLKQPDVSKLMNARHAGFSAERLFRLLNALDQDVRIVVSSKPPTARRDPMLRVEAA